MDFCFSSPSSQERRRRRGASRRKQSSSSTTITKSSSSYIKDNDNLEMSDTPSTSCSSGEKKQKVLGFVAPKSQAFTHHGILRHRSSQQQLDDNDKLSDDDDLVGRRRRRNTNSFPTPSDIATARLVCPPTPKTRRTNKSKHKNDATVYLYEFNAENNTTNGDDHHSLVPVQEIGVQGKFGSVLLVQDVKDKQFYALKSNKCENRNVAEDIACIEVWKELNSCDSIFMVKMKSAWREGCSFVRVKMELCNGGNLFQYSDYCIKENIWSENHIWRCMFDVVTGLNVLHSMSYCHNDIKPCNLLVHSGVVKLGDFGHVRKIDQFGEEGDFRYLCKQALDGRSSIPCDIFSLGISFFSIAGDIELPEVDMWHDLRNGNIPLIQNSFFSKKMHNLLCKMMDPDLLKRPDTDILLRDLHIYKNQNLPEIDLFGAIKEQYNKRMSSRDRFVSTPPPFSIRNSMYSKKNTCYEQEDEVLFEKENNNNILQEEEETENTNSPRKCLLDDFNNL